MAYATYKSVEVATLHTSLTPCIFDDEPLERDSLSALISDIGYEPIPTGDPEEALRLIRSGRSRLVLPAFICRISAPFEFLDRALRCDPGGPPHRHDRRLHLDNALEAIRRGATDFLPKPVDHARLKRTLDEVAALYDQRRRVRALEEQLLKDLEFHGIVGKSPAMLEVFDSLARLPATTPMFSS